MGIPDGRAPVNPQSTIHNPQWISEEPLMPVAEEAVREALKQVVDPELFINVIDLGLVYGLELTPGEQPETADKTNVKIEMTLTSPACPAGPQLIAQAKQVLGRLEGVGNVEVKLVMAPPWSPDKMTEAARDQLGIF
jgi:metal-sulfur cluster biosynthetic enzyme